MWIMTSFGILMPAAIPAELDPEGGLLQIRTRDRQTLVELKRQLPHLENIHHTPEMDYQYRAYVPRAAFAAWLADYAAEIDYTKFKPTVDRYPRTARRLHDLYLRIWGEVYEAYQPRRRSERKDWWAA